MTTTKNSSKKKIYKTTVGYISYDEVAAVDGVSDPDPPDNLGNWKLVGSAVGHMKYDSQSIFWFWEKELD